jgi:hypothetical protein
VTHELPILAAVGCPEERLAATAGAWDCTYHDDDDRQSIIEQRNGSNQTIKQQVWATGYVDGLPQAFRQLRPAGRRHLRDSVLDLPGCELQCAWRGRFLRHAQGR